MPQWLLIMLLARTFMPHRKHYAPMEASQLKRYPILAKIGIFPVESARATVGALRGVYDTLGAGPRLEHDVFDGPHMWHGVRAYDFLAEHL